MAIQQKKNIHKDKNYQNKKYIKNKPQQYKNYNKSKNKKNTFNKHNNNRYFYNKQKRYFYKIKTKINQLNLNKIQIKKLNLRSNFKKAAFRPIFSTLYFIKLDLIKIFNKRFKFKKYIKKKNWIFKKWLVFFFFVWKKKRLNLNLFNILKRSTLNLFLLKKKLKKQKFKTKLAYRFIFFYLFNYFKYLIKFYKKYRIKVLLNHFKKISWRIKKKYKKKRNWRLKNKRFYWVFKNKKYKIKAVNKIFKYLLLNYLVNNLISTGNRNKAYFIFMNLILLFKYKQISILEIVYNSVKNVRPLINFKTMYIGGKKYKIPVILNYIKGYKVALRLIIKMAKENKKNNFILDLHNELLDSTTQESNAIKKRKEIHLNAIENKSYIRFLRFLKY